MIDKVKSLLLIAQNLGLKIKYHTEEIKDNKFHLLLTHIKDSYELEIYCEYIRVDAVIGPCPYNQIYAEIKLIKEIHLGDKAFIGKMVEISGLILSYASLELKNDIEIVQKALSQNIAAFEYCSEELQTNLSNDKLVALGLIKKNGLFLKYLSEELKCDKEIALAALAQNPDAYYFAPNSLVKEPEIISAALGYSEFMDLSNRKLKSVLNYFSFSVLSLKKGLSFSEWCNNTRGVLKNYSLDNINQVYKQILEERLLRKYINNATDEYNKNNYKDAIIQYDIFFKKSASIYEDHAINYLSAKVKSVNPDIKLNKEHPYYVFLDNLIEQYNSKISKNQVPTQSEENANKLMQYQPEYKIGFGVYEGEKIIDVINKDPQCIFEYIIRLYHFSISNTLLITGEFSNKNDYIKAIEINIIKTELLDKLNQYKYEKLVQESLVRESYKNPYDYDEQFNPPPNKDWW